MGTANVTLREIGLTGRDGTTGWRSIGYGTSTVKAIRFSRGASFRYENIGVYAREDAAFLIQDPVHVYDQIYTADLRYYQVRTVQKHTLLDSHFFYETQCSELPQGTAAPGSATWKTNPSDPRSRVKAWIDANVRDAQILKDDGVTEASWECMFANPPYPLELEFRGLSNVDGFYLVGRPTNSTPLMDPATKAPYGYRERLPITISTVDSEGVTGTMLNWRMEAELRYVFENYPTGSLLSSGGSRGRPVHLGSTTLYETEVPMDYRRDTVT